MRHGPTWEEKLRDPWYWALWIGGFTPSLLVVGHIVFKYWVTYPATKDWVDAANVLGSIAGALATSAATVTALWFAVKDRRESRIQAGRMAEVVAARMAPRVSTVLGGAASLHARLTFEDDALALMRDLFDTKFLQFEDDALNPTAEDLVALLPLPNHCANRIARACSELRTVRDQLKRGKALYGAFDSMSRDEKAHWQKAWRKQVGDAVRMLQVAQRDLLEAAETGAPEPTVYELHGIEPEDDH